MSKHKGRTDRQTNQYDKIWRENMQAALPGIIEKVLKINIVQRRDLPDKLLITKQREVDVLQEVVDLTGNKFILHIEIQVRDDPDMVYRMAEYRIMVERQYRISARQYVIYIGSGKSKMTSILDSKGLYFEYGLINLSQVSHKLFLSSDQPEENLLAILGDLDGEDPEVVISTVLRKVQQTAKMDLSENRHIQQLRMLIQLRNLAKQFDRAMEKVSKFFKEEKDPFFQRGIEKGMEQGIEKGREQGIEQGIEQKNNEVVRNLIRELGLSDEQAASVAGVTVEFVREVRAYLVKK
jgi:predicted transposase/invertase (TIGR01784 family)